MKLVIQNVIITTNRIVSDQFMMHLDSHIID